MAGLFSAYLQKELTHNICADCEPTGNMNARSRYKKKISNCERSRACMNETFCTSRI